MAKKLKFFILTVALITASCYRLFAGDKVYKNYQDYVEGKPAIEGAITVEDWSALVKHGYMMKIKKSDNQVEKIDVRDIWGFEQNENLDGMTHAQFLFRVTKTGIYRCLSKGKFNCWVKWEDKPLLERNAQIYTLMPGMFVSSSYGNNSGQNPACWYTTSLESDLIKLSNANDFWAVILPAERARVEAEMKKTKLVKYPHYAVQFYDKLYPEQK